MNLYSIRAFDRTADESPSRTYIVTADSEDEAMQILSNTAYKSQHAEFEIAMGKLETSAPGPQFWGWTGGARMLKAGK